MNKIYVVTSLLLSFTTIKYTHIYYKKLKFITTYACKYRLCATVHSQEKWKRKDTVLNHYCRKLTVVIL